MKRKYFLYAGYHELWISEKNLGRPLTYIGYSKTLGNAIAKAKKYDPDVCICFDESLKEELREHYEELDTVIDEETVNILMASSCFFKGESYDLANGVCEITKESLNRQFECNLSFADVREIAMFLHLKTKKSFRSIGRKILGRTYKYVYPMMQPYLQI